ncbi:hypothetical protein SK128_021770 [Halocaridina rubra]|uniref:Uncharacterized protein n=1 Tax=Halocaridina rubra TaxID=373956 RepID=A0AAN8WST6_HALRR
MEGVEDILMEPAAELTNEEMDNLVSQCAKTSDNEGKPQLAPSILHFTISNILRRATLVEILETCRQEYKNDTLYLVRSMVVSVTHFLLLHLDLLHSILA